MFEHRGMLLSWQQIQATSGIECVPKWCVAPFLTALHVVRCACRAAAAKRGAAEQLWPSQASLPPPAAGKPPHCLPALARQCPIPCSSSRLAGGESSAARTAAASGIGHYGKLRLLPAWLEIVGCSGPVTAIQGHAATAPAASLNQLCPIRALPELAQLPGSRACTPRCALLCCAGG